MATLPVTIKAQRPMTTEKCLSHFLNLLHLLNHADGLPATSIYREVMETARCDELLSAKKQEKLRDLRSSWVDHVNADVDLFPDPAQSPLVDAPSKRLLRHPVSLEDAERAMDALAHNGRYSYESIVSCLPWHSMVYHRFVHDPLVPILESLRIGSGLATSVKSAGRLLEEKRVAAKPASVHTRGWDD